MTQQLTPDGEPVIKPQDAPGYWDTRKQHSHDVLRHPCPHCGASPRQPCTRGSQHPPYRIQTQLPHPSRYEKAGLPDPAAMRTRDLDPPQLWKQSIARLTPAPATQHEDPLTLADLPTDQEEGMIEP